LKYGERRKYTEAQERALLGRGEKERRVHKIQGYIRRLKSP